ncbi:MAG TPA: RecX family transcriptional regulator [Aliidongia sp.]|uniref:regulatory protein RecX n=1 Tax=Aliidongia sp. TaxID=1914230 RepID=UPI002DDCB533|nr:RecX family transcriptional regulator [Aliidongia sp.]HEV2677578.1 RecX family transcriptional regulator [Aliidongia sp.]
MTNSEAPKNTRPPRKLPKPATPERLEAIALFHLERFASSAANLKRVLLRRVQRSAQLHGTDPAAGAAAIEALVARFVQDGLLDDKLYAEARTARLHRRGASARKIAASLAEKGIDREVISATLDEADGDDGYSVRPGGDLVAAAALARRRRLGPYRLPEMRAEFRQKDLGTLARAGFGRAIAERVLSAETPDALRDLVEEG